MFKNKMKIVFSLIIILSLAGCSINLSGNETNADTMPPFSATDPTPETNNHYFTGVYYLARTEKGLVSGYRDTDYFVEFFDDGTAMWWDDPEYSSSSFYTGDYTYNDNRDCYMLKIENHSTYVVTKNEDTVTIMGGTFDNEVFKKSQYDNIVDAADDWWAPIQELRDSR